MKKIREIFYDNKDIIKGVAIGFLICKCITILLQKRERSKRLKLLKIEAKLKDMEEDIDNLHIVVAHQQNEIENLH